MTGPGNDADAINGTDRHARFAAGAHVLVQKSQHFGQFLLRHEQSL